MQTVTLENAAKARETQETEYFMFTGFESKEEKGKKLLIVV